MIAWLLKKTAGWLSWKLVAVLVLAAGAYVGALHLQLRAARSARDAAQIEAQVARDANATNLDTIEQLQTANKSFAEAARLGDEAARRMKEHAEQARRDAARARQELKRLQELDRRAPDCAALLDRRLAACPDLVRRLWPSTDRTN